MRTTSENAPSPVPPPHVLIVEPNPDGHRFYYVRLLADTARSTEATATLLTSPAAPGSTEFGVHLAGCVQDGLNVVTRPVRAGAMGLAPRQIANTAARLGVDLILVPDADRFLVPWTLFVLGQRVHRRSAPRLHALVMRSPLVPATGARRRLTALVKRVMLELAVRAAVADRVFVLTGQSAATGKVPRGCVPLGDPVSVSYRHVDASALRAELGLPVEGRIFGLLGRISARKNPQLVIEAFASLSADINARLLLAGALDDPVRRLLAGVAAQDRLGKRLIVDDRYLDEQTFHKYLAAVDCLILPYNTEAPSGLLGKAALAGVPVLAAGSQLLKQEVAALGIGRTCDLVAADLAGAMRSLVEDIAAGRLPSPARARQPAVGVEDVFARRFLGCADVRSDRVAA